MKNIITLSLSTIISILLFVLYFLHDLTVFELLVLLSLESISFYIKAIYYKLK